MWISIPATTTRATTIELRLIEVAEAAAIPTMTSIATTT